MTPLAQHPTTAIWFVAGYLAFFCLCLSVVSALNWPVATGVLDWGRKLVLGPALLALIWYDVREYRLPDLITLPLIFSGLAFAWLDGGQTELFFALIAVTLGYGLIWGVGKAWTALRGAPGIGLGDAKLLAAGGAWCGLLNLPLLITLASGAGLLIAFFVARFDKNKRIVPSAVIPFGLALAPAIWVLECLTRSN